MTQQPLSQLSFFDEPVSVEVPTKPETPKQQGMFSQRDVAQFGVSPNPRKIQTPVPPSLKMSRHNADGKTDEQLANEAAQEKQLPLPDSQLESIVQLSAQPDVARNLLLVLLDYTTDDTEPVALNPKIRAHSIPVRRAITSVVHAFKNGLLSEAFQDQYDGYSEKQRLALYAVLAVDCSTTNAIIQWLNNQFGDDAESEPEKRVDAESTPEAEFPIKILKSKYYPINYDQKVIYIDPQNRASDCDFISAPKYKALKTVGVKGKRLLNYKDTYVHFEFRPAIADTASKSEPIAVDPQPIAVPDSYTPSDEMPTTQQEIDPITQAILYLAAVCDGAEKEDGNGFNKPDSSLGHHLATMAQMRPLADDEKNQALPMLQKYRGQLANAGIQLPDLPADHVTPAEVKQPYTVDYRNLYAVIKFKFSYPLKDLVKSIPGSQFRKQFSGVDNAWIIPPKNWDDMYQVLGEQAFYTPEFEAVRDNTALLDIQQENDPSEVPEAGQIYFFRKRVYIAFPYDEATKDKVKAIEGSQFHTTLKQWSVPLAALDIVLKMFPDFHVDDGIEKMKEKAAKAKIQADKLKAKREKLEQEQRERETQLINSLQPELQTTLDNPPLPDDWSLFEHQKIGIEFLVNRRNAILADDMGLGKTLMALLAARVYQQTLGAQVIVVCPASVRKNWQKEAKMFDTRITDFSWAKQPIVQYKLDDEWFEYDDLDKDQRRRAKKAEWRVKLVGYDAGNIIKQDQPFVLIADEAHYAQSMSSNRSKALRNLADKATATFLLSGTPAKNGRPINILPLLVAINHPIASNKRQFKKKFCNPRPTMWGMDYNGVANLTELYQALSSSNTLLRRTKEECLDLPEKTRIFKAVSLSAKAEKVYEERFAQKKAEYHQRVNEGKITTAAEAVVMLNFLRQAASVGKTEHAIELALEVMQQGKPVIIFTEFKDTITAIQKAVEKAGFPVDVIQGSTKGDDRQTIAEKYQTGEPKPSCFIGTKAAQEGITLTDADTVILIDRPWTPGDAIQREDRTWRIGQRNCVTAYWLQYGVDADIDGLILEKQANANEMLTGERTTLKGTRSGSIAVQALKAVFED